MESGFYADAVEAACKALNARVREIVKVKTGEELDGAKLMQKAFSVAIPSSASPQEKPSAPATPSKATCRYSPE